MWAGQFIVTIEKAAIEYIGNKSVCVAVSNPYKFKPTPIIVSPNQNL